MIRFVVACLIAACSLEPASPPADALPSPPPAISARVRVAWAGQDVTTTDPEDSRVPRMLSGPMSACPIVVGDPVVQVQTQLVVGTQDAYVADAAFDCALGSATLVAPAGPGTLALSALTASGYVWLVSMSTLSIEPYQTVDLGTVDLNNEIPTSSGGCDDDDGCGDGWF